MSYLVLARKYRPKNFSEMVGQSHVVQALGNALTTQRLHHAYLFTGTRGVGKTTISRILAKSLNCIGTNGQGGITATPCGVCQACTDIDSGRFVDYTELDAASNRGVDEIAQLLEQAVYKPVVGRFKVFMIDEVHMLTNTAFNAMLKTLEEPPEYLKFVLATTDPQKVPATVLSRCLQFNLRPMAPETILEHLGHVLGIEDVPSEPQALRLLARAARGSMRDALSLTDQAIAFGSGALQEASVRLMLGSVDRSYVFKLLDALARCDGKTVVETSEALRLNGLSAASTLEEMTTVLQRMAVLQAVPDMMAKSLQADDDTDPEASETARLAQTLPTDETQLLYSLCLHGRGELGLAPDEYAALTMVLLRLLAFKPSGSVPLPVASKTGSAAEPGKKPQSLPEPVQAPHPEPVRAAPVALAQHAAAADPKIPPPPLDNSGFEVPNSPTGQSIEAPLAPESISSPAATMQASAPVKTALGDVWAALVTQLIALEAIKTMARELALQSQLMACDGPAWVLRVESPSLNSPANIERLQTAINAEQPGTTVQLAVEIGPVTDTPVRRNQALAKQRQAQAEALIHNDPFVQDLMRHWGGNVVPGSIKHTPPTAA
jgi:DNA polymerase-3 subunit gamma/tau